MNHQRRNFIKLSSATAAWFGLAPAGSSKIPFSQVEELLNRQAPERPQGQASVINLRKAPLGQVKVAMLGLGNRGTGQAKLVNALFPDKAKITAICDMRDIRIPPTLDTLKASGQTPVVYSGSKDGWMEMCRRDDVDLVVICTPWDDHVPMAVYAMQQGKHVAIEVPAAMTLQGCWDLVNTAEQMQVNCMMLENVCYGDEELWVLNMVHHGVFGTLTYGEAAYIHNLKDQLFGSEHYQHNWRMAYHLKQDGNHYPTHGLGPVAQYMSINRGDKFNHLVSMSSLQASLSEYSKTVETTNEFYNRTDFVHGDMDNTLVKTAMGRTILIQHDVVTPRPYSRINALAGTKAYHEGYPSRLAIAGKDHEWLDEAAVKEYQDKYRHPIWDKLKDGIAKNGGHGGMDFVQMYRLIDCLNQGWPLDMDVYDATAWSSIVELSKISIELGSIPVKCPDFTRGAWEEKRQLGIFQNI
ncbi:MAG: Gfo/Idh/MocA family oxidoreductase [Saprospiraceae bacterium]|nr:Gfo/Idh/MocA family oxidoreductase [Saprospiraceae bacterium]